MSRAEQATRESFIEAAGGQAEAIAAENAALSIGREFLPPFALAVLDKESEGSPEYWAWLIESVEQQEAEAEAEAVEA